MRIYDFLFYKAYQIAKRNFEEWPLFGAVFYVSLCVMQNIFAVALLLNAWGINIDFKREYKIVYAIILLGSLILYYKYKGRYKKILAKYENKKGTMMSLPPIVVFLIYFIVSFLLAFLAALYKNKDWIFAQ